MKKLSDIFIWFIMFNKRLFRKKSFLILLLMIPLIVSSATFVMSDEKSMLKIGLYAADDDANAKAVIDSLLSKDSVLSYTLYTQRDILTEDVKTAKIDSAWIFEEDFSDKLRSIVQKKKNQSLPLTLIEREETVPQRLSRVQLITEIFTPLSKIVCEEYVYGENPSYDKLPKEDFDRLFSEYSNKNKIIELKKIGTYATDDVQKNDYLVSPVRGLLSVMITVCGLAACLYFLYDKSSGKYQWLPSSRHLIPAITMCFSAVLISALTVLLTLPVSGIFTSPVQELPAILILIFSATAFSFFFCAIFNDAGKFGALIPALLIILIALSPIFFNIKVLAPIRFLLPTTYYLHSLYAPVYLLYGAIYTVAAFGVTIFIHNLKVRNTNS